MTAHKKPAVVRLRPETRAMLDLLVQDTGLTRTGVIELAVHDLAKRRSVLPPAMMPTPIGAPAQRPSLLGGATGVPGGTVVDEALRP